MKLVLVQPYYFNIWEALGLGYIAAFVKKHYKGALDLSFFQGNFDADDQIVAGCQNADIVAFSSTSPTFACVVTLAGKIKDINPGVRIVVGGFHPSAVPQDCLEHDCIDQVVVGEGEKAMLDIMLGKQDPIVNGEPFLEFDSLVPDREVINNQRTIDLCENMVGQRISSFQSVRVCPFRCAFCSERTVTGKFHEKNNPVRHRDTNHLLDEIIEVSKKYSLDYFKFVDATWNTSSRFIDKVTEFCEEKQRRGFDLPWEANIHAAFATKEMFRKMKDAGCVLINIGCESGSQKILNDMKKGVTVDKVKQVFQWGREVGLERRSFFLIGMPNETEEDLRATEQLIDDIQPDIFGVTILCPYPGSDLYDPVTMKNWDWSCADEYSNPYWQTQYFTNEKLKKWQKAFSNKVKDKLAWHQQVLHDQDCS